MAAVIVNVVVALQTVYFANQTVDFVLSVQKVIA